MQILSYERLNNPLQTFIGNENLDQVKYHSLNLGFRNYNVQSRSGWSTFLSGSFYDSQIVSSTVFDENRKRTTTYENVSGAYSLSLYGNWNKSYRINEHSIRYGINARSEEHTSELQSRPHLVCRLLLEKKKKKHKNRKNSQITP